jgi:hypothetical protein
VDDNGRVMLVAPTRSTSTAIAAAYELASNELGWDARLVTDVVSVLGLISGLLLGSSTIGEDQVRR